MAGISDWEFRGFFLSTEEYKNVCLMHQMGTSVGSTLEEQLSRKTFLHCVGSMLTRIAE
jgi:hypothetical protein